MGSVNCAFGLTVTGDLAVWGPLVRFWYIVAELSGENTLCWHRIFSGNRGRSPWLSYIVRWKQDVQVLRPIHILEEGRGGIPSAPAPLTWLLCTAASRPRGRRYANSQKLLIVNSARALIPISDIAVTVKTGDIFGDSSSGDRTMKTGTVPRNWGRLVTLANSCYV